MHRLSHFSYDCGAGNTLLVYMSMPLVSERPKEVSYGLRHVLQHAAQKLLTNECQQQMGHPCPLYCSITSSVPVPSPE